MTDMSSPESLSRREMIGATAAALVTPLLAPRVQAVLNAVPLPPKFLTIHEFALLDELTEMIIPTDNHSPGARAAGVARYIDNRLAESLEPDWQALWRSGLGAVDGLSRELNGITFMQSTPEQRLAVVTRMAAYELRPATPETEVRPGKAAAEAPAMTPAEQFFAELKRTTVYAYYTSKIGIHTDQNYKGNVYQLQEYAGYDAT
jgi:hypothetical protein